MAVREVGLQFFNYGTPTPDDEHMLVVLEIDGEYAGTYWGRFDGNMVRCRISKRARADAPARADVSPEYMINRRGQRLPPKHWG